MAMTDVQRDLIAAVEARISGFQRLDDMLYWVCEQLHETFDTYNWVGIYFMNDENKQLEIGPYRGATTEHTIIPYGKGICGQVAVSGENFVVDDVSAEDNYIACSLDVKSEIVIPIYVNGKLTAQLDIDSHTPSAFGSEDVLFLNTIAELLGENWLSH
jgi:GAF domain-containing protein